MDSGPELTYKKVDLVRSNLPALELLPIDCSRRFSLELSFQKWMDGRQIVFFSEN